MNRIVQDRVVVNRNDGNFNYKQSTHAASVHDSASSSAVRLEALYGQSGRSFDGIAHTGLISHLLPNMVRGYDRALVGDKSDQDISNSVIKSINRLHESTYVDTASQISLSHLLELSFSAVVDSSQWRDGVTEETPLACLYAALYEIEREYALDAMGRDVSQMQSARCCDGGAFNKCIESLSKIHKSCEVNFITPALASIKLPCVVRRVLKQYLSEHDDVSIETLKKDGIDSIWNELEPEVLDIMNRDFSSIYPAQEGCKNAKLVGLVSAGKDIDLTEYLGVLEKELKNPVREAPLMYLG